MKNEQFFASSSNRILAALLLLMVIIALGSYASLNFAKLTHVDPTPATISVSGEGEVFAVPDIGQFSFAVQAEGEDAAAAQEASGTVMNDIIAYLGEAGVAEEDIKTTGYNLYPRWTYEERICPVGSYCPPGERVQDGFEVNQHVEVKVRDTDAAGQLIAGVGERGATNISSLQFTVDDDEAVQAEARAEAIADAQEKARELASQLGVRIVGIDGFYEESGYGMPYAETRMMATMDSADEGGFGGASIPTGEQQTVVRVNVVYQVQ
jgi:hypothetical protein